MFSNNVSFQIFLLRSECKKEKDSSKSELTLRDDKIQMKKYTIIKYPGDHICLIENKADECFI